MSTQEAFLAEKVEKFMRDNIDDQHSAKLMNALVEFGCDCFDFYKAHNDTVIAELVEALLESRQVIDDNLPTRLGQNALDKIDALIAKHKG